jgi:hypothetical protein
MNRPSNIRIGARGQLFSQDIMIATMLFMASLALAIFLWNSYTDEINEAEQIRDFQKIASKSAEQLIRTPGTPPDWNFYTVRSVGLASEDRIINSTLAERFIDLMDSENSTHYDEKKYLMGVGGYDFYFNVTSLNSTRAIKVGGLDFVAGKRPQNPTRSLLMQRTAIYNDTPVRVNFILWN